MVAAKKARIKFYRYRIAATSYHYPTSTMNHQSCYLDKNSLKSEKNLSLAPQAVARFATHGCARTAGARCDTTDSPFPTRPFTSSPYPCPCSIGSACVSSTSVAACGSPSSSSTHEIFHPAPHPHHTGIVDTGTQALPMACLPAFHHFFTAAASPRPAAA